MKDNKQEWVNVPAGWFTSLLNYSQVVADHLPEIDSSNSEWRVPLAGLLGYISSAEKILEYAKPKEANVIKGTATSTTGKKVYYHVNSKGVTYYLHKKDVRLSDGRQQTIHFFTRTIGENKNTPTDLPYGYEVNENPRNGFLTIRKVEAERAK